jgi:hypothetical protein
VSLLSSLSHRLLPFGQEYQNPDRYELAYDLLERTRDSEANLRSGAMVDAGDLFYYGRVNRSLDTGSGVIPLTSNAQMALSLYKEAAESKFPFSHFRVFFLLCWFTSVTVASHLLEFLFSSVPTASGLSSVFLSFPFFSYHYVDLCVRMCLLAFGFVPEFPFRSKSSVSSLLRLSGLVSFTSYLLSLQDLCVWIISCRLLGSSLRAFLCLSCFCVELCLSYLLNLPQVSKPSILLCSSLIDHTFESSRFFWRYFLTSHVKGDRGSKWWKLCHCLSNRPIVCFSYRLTSNG